MNTRRAARAIILRNDQLLVIHRNKFGSKYYTLPGGGIEDDETPEQALVRELAEETSLQLTSYRHVFTEEAYDKFGAQYIFLCDDPGGDARLSDGSEEALSNAVGKNTYQVAWLPVSKLASVSFLSVSVRRAIIDGLQHGFPDSPKRIQP